MVLDEYRYSSGLILRKGDSIRLKDGPFYTKENGTKTSMAFRGDAVIVRIEGYNDKAEIPGIVLTVQEIRGGSRWAYHHCRISGPTKTRDDSGVVARPYKVVKARHPHAVNEIPFPKAL